MSDPSSAAHAASLTSLHRDCGPTGKQPSASPRPRRMQSQRRALCSLFSSKIRTSWTKCSNTSTVRVFLIVELIVHILLISRSRHSSRWVALHLRGWQPRDGCGWWGWQEVFSGPGSLGWPRGCIGLWLRARCPRPVLHPHPPTPRLRGGRAPPEKRVQHSPAWGHSGEDGRALHRLASRPHCYLLRSSNILHR